MKYFFTHCSVLLLCTACNSGMIIENKASPQPSAIATPKKPLQSDVAIRTQFWLDRSKRNSYDPLARIKAGTSLLLLARETGNHTLYPQAESILRESLAIGPGSYDALVMLAFALSGQHRFSEAADAANQALKINPYEQTAWAASGDAAFEQGQLLIAKKAYAKVLQFDRSLFGLTRWANLALAEGNISMALSSFAEGAKTGISRSVANSEIARCYIQMGEIHFQLGQFKQAEKYYQKALALWPNGYLPLEHLAELRASENKLTLSSELYSRVIELAPHPDLLEAYAGVLEKMGKTRVAKQFYQQAYNKYLLASEQGDPSYFRHLAFFLTDQKQQPQQALIWAKKDLAIRATPHSYATLAWVLYHLGSQQMAEQSMDKALINEPSLNAIWLYRAGIVYHRSNRKKLASRLLNKSLNLNPNHPDAMVIKQILRKAKQ